MTTAAPSTPFDLVIQAERAIVFGREQPACFAISDGSIVAVGQRASRVGSARVVSFDDDVVVIPGLVDTHVHINSPGHDDWEGFASATRAAAAGGITTLVDMPLDSIPVTTTATALQQKRLAASGNCFVDVGFWGGLVPGNLPELTSLHSAGVLGFKCFLGSGTADFPAIDPMTLQNGLLALAELDCTLLVHAEDDAFLTSVAPRLPSSRYQDFLDSRPEAVEKSAVATVISALRQTRGKAHIVHLSSGQALKMIASAQREGLAVSAETCPHYLALAAEDIADGQTSFTCCPPIRQRHNSALLFAGLADGTLSAVVSDHSPATPAMKLPAGGDFSRAWGGISSLQVSLPVTWSAAHARGIELSEVIKWMSSGPARLAGLAHKGQLAVGFDADFAVLDPDAEFVVKPAELYHRQPITPYAGAVLRGVVRETWLAGHRLDPANQRAPARGRLLNRHD